MFFRKSDNLLDSYREAKGLWYLKGGMYSFIQILEKYIRDNGGTIKCNTICEKFLMEGDSIKGIKTEKGCVYGDIFVCNSDYSFSIQNFIEREHDKQDNKINQNRNFKYSCSVFMAYLGLKKKYKSLEVHNMYIGPNFKKNIQAAFKRKIPLEPSLYIYCPSKIDDTMAPEGKDAINVMIRVPNTFHTKIIWNKAQIKKMRDRLMQALQKIEGFEDINNNIEFEKYLTPKDLEEKFNCSYGNAFGISHNLTKTAFLRPQIKSQQFNNLYLIGDSVHPGSGVSLVLLGSKLLCEYL